MFQKLCCTYIGSFITLITLQDDILVQPTDRKWRPRRNIPTQSCRASEQHSWGLKPDLCCTRAHALSSTSEHHRKAWLWGLLGWDGSSAWLWGWLWALVSLERDVPCESQNFPINCTVIWAWILLKEKVVRDGLIWWSVFQLLPF